MTNGNPDPVKTTASASSSRTIFHEDDYTHPCHPLYVHPSDVLGTSLVSTPFDGTCYGSWRRTVLVALSIRNKTAFIIGTTGRPPDGSPLARQWQRCNDLVISWLVNSLSKDIARSVEYSEFAKDIWNELEERYGKANGARVFELKKELAHISQGSLDIASYFNKIKQLWDEIASISAGRARVCTCGAKSAEDEEQRAYQFLMGLNETYVQTRSNILMMKPLPSVGTVYSILLSDEKQRQVSAGTQFPSNSASFIAGVLNPTPNHNLGLSKPTYPSKVSFKSTRSSGVCKYCKKPGHSIDRCYKLYGFPPNFRPTKNLGPKRSAAHVELDPNTMSGIPTMECGAAMSQSQCQSSSAVPGLTKDQYSQLMMLLQQQTQITASPPDSNLIGSANFAGMLPTQKGVSYGACMMSRVDGIIWKIDSGASDHMTSNKNLLFNIQTLPVPYLVSLPNGYKVKVTSIGSVVLFPDLTLHNVIYIPSFQYNLISVHKLLCHDVDIVQFTKAACTLQGPSLKKPVVLGRLDNGLYKLFQQSISAGQQCSTLLSSSLNAFGYASCSSSATSDASLVNTIDVPNKVNNADVAWHL
ncbi:PREDICTED: uncharacterized protein LOC109209521 [Nicotiana attenuata]|uniref:uncharacterized protein LOC109209521 n=1 Tax=Nicotiana attenuata TaxID=49451 RepID=UPI0009052230|nr:PREDICTED: uncharacterized protein LOC109209521 [Nicotiana attenuata]